MHTKKQIQDFIRKFAKSSSYPISRPDRVPNQTSTYTSDIALSGSLATTAAYKGKSTSTYTPVFRSTYIMNKRMLSKFKVN